MRPTSLKQMLTSDLTTPVVWEWISTGFGSAAYPVQGIHVFTVDSNGLIASVHFEFNSFAAGLDTGYTIYYPNGTKYGA